MGEISATFWFYLFVLVMVLGLHRASVGIKSRILLAGLLLGFLILYVSYISVTTQPHLRLVQKLETTQRLLAHHETNRATACDTSLPPWRLELKLETTQRLLAHHMTNRATACNTSLPLPIPFPVFRPSKEGEKPMVCNVLIGVMCMCTSLSAMRDDLRRSLMRATSRQALDCTFRLIFFMGKQKQPDGSLYCAPSIYTEAQSHGDIVVGDFEENMEGGKTFEWFKYGSKMSQFDIIIKMDSDTTVHWGSLSKVLHKNVMLGLPLYIGRNNNAICGFPELPWCPPLWCKNFDGACWIYMSGGFYGVTSATVRGLMQNPWTSMYTNSVHLAAEDLLFAYWLLDASKKGYISMLGLQLLDFPNGLHWCHGSNAHGCTK